MNDLWKYNTETGHWTWMKGSSSSVAPSIYGSKGEGNPANTPGARAAASTWFDGSGNLWLFGGRGGPSPHSISDLWKYEPLTGNWIWMHGSDQINQPGNYGVRGVATSETCPGARHRGASWIDNDGHLWMFGGEILGPRSLVSLNDLWKFNTVSNRWTWMGGSNTVNSRGTYGVQGVPAPDNIPGARNGSVSWTDSQGNLWLFGGTGIGATSGGLLNDLWKFTPSTGLWTWVKGADQPTGAATYGEQGVPAPGNNPSSAYGGIGWKDSTDRLWLMGGIVGQGNGTSALWNYNIATGNWTWINGALRNDERATYPAQVGTPHPGPRSHAPVWYGTSGRLWLFGGLNGFLRGNEYLQQNDLWYFEPEAVPARVDWSEALTY